MSSIDMKHLAAPKEEQKWATKYRMLTFCQKKNKTKEWAQSIVLSCQSSLVSHNLWPFKPKTYYAQYLFQQPWRGGCSNGRRPHPLRAGMHQWLLYSQLVTRAKLRVISFLLYENSVHQLMEQWAALSMIKFAGSMILVTWKPCLWRCPQSFHFISRVGLHISSASSNHSWFFLIFEKEGYVCVCVLS